MINSSLGSTISLHTHTNESWLTHTNESCHPCTRVMSHTQMGHDAHAYQPFITYVWVLAYTRMSHVTSMSHRSLSTLPLSLSPSLPRSPSLFLSLSLSLSLSFSFLLSLHPSGSFSLFLFLYFSLSLSIFLRTHNATDNPWLSFLSLFTSISCISRSCRSICRGKCCKISRYRQ